MPMALAESMTLPPPTARMKSIFSRRQMLMPSRTSESLGLGTTPGSSTQLTPASARDRHTAA